MASPTLPSVVYCCLAEGFLPPPGVAHDGYSHWRSERTFREGLLAAPRFGGSPLASIHGARRGDGRALATVARLAIPRSRRLTHAGELRWRPKRALRAGHSSW